MLVVGEGSQAKEEGTGETPFGRVEGSRSAVRGEVLCLRTTEIPVHSARSHSWHSQRQRFFISPRCKPCVSGIESWCLPQNIQEKWLFGKRGSCFCWKSRGIILMDSMCVSIRFWPTFTCDQLSFSVCEAQPCSVSCSYKVGAEGLHWRWTQAGLPGNPWWNPGRLEHLGLLSGWRCGETGAGSNGLSWEKSERVGGTLPLGVMWLCCPKGQTPCLSPSTAPRGRGSLLTDVSLPILSSSPEVAFKLFSGPWFFSSGFSSRILRKRVYFHSLRKEQSE